ncbi:Mce protein [Mycolicibacterium sp. CBMA 234]|uniref:Mce protein n=1 Tax=Mycolicibacterium sp. CBMA 234 TaxID=1918495 RepID=UPI0012DD736B|nr:Mce protein [Mycolicibacterium sp. CBMA 234]
MTGNGKYNALEIDSAARLAPRPTSLARRTVVFAIAIVVISLAAATGTLGWQFVRQHARDAAASQALAAARSFAVTLTSTDQNAIDKNFADVLGGATGDFKDIYGKTAAQMRKMLIDNKVNTTGTVGDAAVKSVHGNDVDVLLSMKQEVTSSAVPQPRTEFVSVSLTMRKVGGKWLAAEVQLAGQPKPQHGGGR